MGISGISSGAMPSGTKSIAPAGGGNSQEIQQLEKKLQQLNKEKSKAAAANDKEKQKAIEKQIAEVEKEIQKLKSQKRKGQEEASASEKAGKQAPPEEQLKDPALGNYVDEWA